MDLIYNKNVLNVQNSEDNVGIKRAHSPENITQDVYRSIKTSKWSLIAGIMHSSVPNSLFTPQNSSHSEHNRGHRGPNLGSLFIALTQNQWTRLSNFMNRPLAQTPTPTKPGASALFRVLWVQHIPQNCHKIRRQSVMDLRFFCLFSFALGMAQNFISQVCCGCRRVDSRLVYLEL